MPAGRLVLGVWTCFAACFPPAPAATIEKCASCHPEAVAGYLKTGMGRSISRPANQLSGRFEHSFSGSAFTIEGSDSGMIQRMERDGLSAEYPVEFVIGSGNAAFGYLIRLGRHVYQSPVAYYTKRGRWDMAPGFENHPQPDFDRPVLHECLWCHAGRPAPAPFSQNRYSDPVLELEAISCDRCHGQTEAHLAAPSPDTILNPAKLPAAQRDSVCEQCHLSGEQRILNPGKTFGAFQPGMELEEVFSVYVNDHGRDAAGRFKVVSHFEQLKLSPCRQKSGERMWCGTCHNPHEKPQAPVSYYRARCLRCHGEALSDRHPQPAEDCVACHMARRHARDSGHSAFTDHLIARRPDQSAGAELLAPRLRAWREPPDKSLTQRNLGMAYLQVGRRKQRQDYLDEGASLLAQLAQTGSLDSEALEELGSVLVLKQAPPEAGIREAALRLLGDALRLAPDEPGRYRTLAAALWQSGDREKAIELLNQAIEIDPQVEAAYQVLARIYQESDQPEMALQTWKRYLEAVPQSLSARQALRELQPLGTGVQR